MDTLTQPPAPPTARLRHAVGRRRDWLPVLRRPRPPMLGLDAVGPLTVAATTMAGWWAFAGTSGEAEAGTVALGLFLGSASIVLMAWSFVLAVRVRAIEPLFGGLDRAYGIHRWAGTLAVLAMFLHARMEPEVRGGVRGAAKAVAEQATDLAGTGEVLLYALVGLSLLRLFPYRWWRWTHKLLGVPYVFACWHMFTAAKPYANGSAWGWWFGTIMVGGAVAWLVRVIGRDALSRGALHEVVAADVHGATVDLRLRPVGRSIVQRPGQFAVLKLERTGLREPHVFTIASGPDDPELRFLIRDLGDWTSRLRARADELVGTRVRVEGPYGRFEALPTARHRRVVWVAGGVGVTPFLATAATLAPAAPSARPTFFLCVRDRKDALGLSELERAAAEGRLDLEVVASREGPRFGAATLQAHFPDGLDGAHVAVCGPSGLVALVDREARRLGATDVEHEDFDLRRGVGPEVSRDVDAVLAAVRGG